MFAVEWNLLFSNTKYESTGSKFGLHIGPKLLSAAINGDHNNPSTKCKYFNRASNNCNKVVYFVTA